MKPSLASEAFAALVWELKGQLDLQQPRVVAGFGPYRVVIDTEVQLHGLSAKLKRLAEVGADWDRPFPATGDPKVPLPAPKPVTKSSVIVTLPEGDSPAMLDAVGVSIIPEQPVVASTTAASATLSDGTVR